MSAVRILVVGHSYVTPFAQEKIVEMQRCAPNAELHLLIPDHTVCAFGDLQAERHPSLREEAFHVCMRAGGASNISYWFEPQELRLILARVRPSVVVIDEDPFSLCMVGVLIALGRLSIRPLIACFIWDNLNRKRPLWRWLAKSWVQFITFADIGLFICGNHAAQRLLGSEKNYRGRSTVLPQVGAVVPETLGRAFDAAPNKSVRIGFVGRLVEEKGLLVLFEACSLLLDCNWTLTIVGSGPLSSQLVAVAHRLGFGDRLTLLGGVPHGEVIPILTSLDIFVLPSHRTNFWEEQFGITLVQAMGSGCACIGSDSGAIPDVLGESGLIFPQTNAKNLAVALRAFAESPELRRRLGEAAHRRALTCFSSKAVARKYMNSLGRVHEHGSKIL